MVSNPRVTPRPEGSTRRDHGLLESPVVGVPLMIACEIYARARGIYRDLPPPHIHDYPLSYWPPKIGPQNPIVAFGDSMTEGVGARPEGSYPAQLSAMIGQPIINAGRSGDTTAEALDRLPNDVLSHDPGLVLLCLGGNDLIQRVSVQESMDNLRRMIEILHSSHIPVMILGLRGSWLLRMDHDRPTRLLARETGCPLIPLILDRIWGIPWLMAEHVHPNRRGYRELARRVAAAFHELIPETLNQSKE